MGDGKNLKELIDAKGTNVRQLAKASGLKASTLYSIIQKDTNIIISVVYFFGLKFYVEFVFWCLVRISKIP